MVQVDLKGLLWCRVNLEADYGVHLEDQQRHCCHYFGQVSWHCHLHYFLDFQGMA